MRSASLGNIPETMQRLLDVAYNNSDRLASLINDLLEMEKLVAGKMTFNISPLNLAEELHQAVDNIQPFANQHGIKLIVAVDSQLVVFADTLRLQQILTNLLSNAIKFSPRDASVEIDVKPFDDKVQIRVSDHGIGIATEFQPRIFDRFAQADGSSSRQKGGTGLGLSICKELVEQMNGNISFSSESGVGTCFVVTLPSVSGELAESHSTETSFD